jgi:hypothetical protein
LSLVVNVIVLKVVAARIEDVQKILMGIINAPAKLPIILILGPDLPI